MRHHRNAIVAKESSPKSNESKASSSKATIIEGSSRSAAMMQLQALLSHRRFDPPINADLVQDRGDKYSSDSALPILHIPRTDKSKHAS